MPIEFKTANDNYLLIEPKEYFYEEQANFFTIEKEPSSFLKNHEFVVFDLETTGTEVPNDEITEIGAVKIINGRIAETFTTLVKPNQSISELITKITGIDDELVKDAPKIEEVMPDFYKFCEGAVLVAYNIAFDYRDLLGPSYHNGPYSTDQRTNERVLPAAKNIVSINLRGWGNRHR